MSKIEMDIFFASDNNFVMHLCVAISSILCNSLPDESFNFYILDDNISPANRQKLLNLRKIKQFNIEFIKVDNELFKDCPQSSHCPQITRQTYYRYIIPKIKPELKKVLYLDCDIVAVSSLKELWNTDLGDKYCAAVQGLTDGYAFIQNARRVDVDATFNAGVMLINSEKWLKENIVDLLFENTIKLQEQDRLWLQDQDALNYTFKGNIIWLNPRFNFQQTSVPKCYHPIYSKEEMQYARKNICLIHYNSSNKPWKKHCDFYRDVYMKYLLVSGFYVDYFKFNFSKWVQNIFSIINKYDRKVITFLGLKLKLKKDMFSLFKIADSILSIGFISDYIDKKFSKIPHKHKFNDFGLLKYDYIPKGYDYYGFGNCVNIGDYIQSLAAKQYIDGDYTLIDRDGLNFYDGKPISMIMNGWFYLYEGNDLIPNNIDPLFISYHINNYSMVRKETLNHLKKYEPIGCRDYTTRNFLLINNIKAYFSGCLTTTLSKKYLKKNTERKGIIYCDFELENDKTDRKINNCIQDILNKYNNENIEKVEHTYPLTLNHEERFKKAEELLDKYSRAKLVITTRIHCALPCLALGTPVILIVKNWDKKRYNGLSKLFNIIGYNKNKKFMCRVEKDNNDFVTNPKNYLSVAKNLETTIDYWKR